MRNGKYSLTIRTVYQKCTTFHVMPYFIKEFVSMRGIMLETNASVKSIQCELLQKRYFQYQLVKLLQEYSRYTFQNMIRLSIDWELKQKPSYNFEFGMCVQILICFGYVYQKHYQINPINSTLMEESCGFMVLYLPKIRV